MKKQKSIIDVTLNQRECKQNHRKDFIYMDTLIKLKWLIHSNQFFNNIIMLQIQKNEFHLNIKCSVSTVTESVNLQAGTRLNQLKLACGH